MSLDYHCHALRRFLNLEKPLIINKDLHLQYVKCVRGYLDLGHISLINSSQNNLSNNFYIPLYFKIHQIHDKIKSDIESFQSFRVRTF